MATGLSQQPRFKFGLEHCPTWSMDRTLHCIETSCKSHCCWQEKDSKYNGSSSGLCYLIHSNVTEMVYWSMSDHRSLQKTENAPVASTAVLANTKDCDYFNPFTPKSDQPWFSLFSLSPEIYHSVWRTWHLIACSDESWLSYQFSLHHSYISSWMIRRICIMSLGVKGLITLLLRVLYILPQN